MTQIAARNPRAWYRVERSAARDRRRRGPTTAWSATRTPSTWSSVMDVDMAGALVARHARARRRARDTARSAGVPARLVLRARSGARRRSIRIWRARRRWRPRARRRCGSPARRSTTSRSSTSTRASRARCTSRATRSGFAVGDPRGVTVTGGLPYHGGPASGYLTHSIAAMVERLRSSPEALGLVSGVGMHMTKHVFGVYRATPGAGRAPRRRAGAQAAVDRAGSTALVAEHDGAGGRARVLGRARSRRRARVGACSCAICPPVGARTRKPAIPELCVDAETTELVGRTVTLSAANGRRSGRPVPSEPCHRGELLATPKAPAAVQGDDKPNCGIATAIKWPRVIDRGGARSLGCAGTITVTTVTLGVTRSAGPDCRPITPEGNT